MKPLELLKFGGTSLASRDARANVVEIIQQVSREAKVVVVVSAMGRYDDAYATDTLASLISDFVSSQEKDRLLSIGEIISSIVLCDELKARGLLATSLSVQKTGILTDDHYGNADVLKVDCTHLREALQQTDIVVVPGFQGMTEEAEVATLGRGGSDYTAVLLGHALGMRKVTIYSDVRGIYTADPKLVTSAQCLNEISYAQAFELARFKAPVLNADAAAYAQKYGLEMELRSTFDVGSGTVVKALAANVQCLSYDAPYLRLCFESEINTRALAEKGYQDEEKKWFFKKTEMKQLAAPYTVLGEYAMLHFVGFASNLTFELRHQPQKEVLTIPSCPNTLFVPLKNSLECLNEWHNQWILHRRKKHA